MIVISDAGPLIYLGGTGKLELLRLLFGAVVVPGQVWDEVIVRGRNEVGSAAVAAATLTGETAYENAGAVYLVSLGSLL